MTINLVSMNAGDTRTVAEWLVDGARSAAQPQQVMAQLCDRLLCCGIPLWRVAVFVCAAMAGRDDLVFRSRHGALDPMSVQRVVKAASVCAGLPKAFSLLAAPCPL